MNRFWESIIKPIFEERQVRNIIEIGSQNGYNTSKILEYCEAFDGHLYCIDPVHPKKLSEWIEKFGSHLTFYPTLSLSALPLIDNFDAVLIDGDHNWYTVINELEILESKVVENNISPVIFLHDIGWPYGRRDLYYNPSNIPGAYIQAYSKNGVVPGESNLNKEGLNSHLNNSIYENNPRNGVLTAVEDFLKKTHLEFEFLQNTCLSRFGNSHLW